MKEFSPVRFKAMDNAKSYREMKSPKAIQHVERTYLPLGRLTTL